MLHPMPSFGSASLYVALALSCYALVIGALSLWSMAFRRPLAVNAEVLRETARDAEDGMSAVRTYRSYTFTRIAARRTPATLGRSNGSGL